MPAIRRLDNALVCHAVHETVRIEPWGVDSLRVRATMAPAIQDGPLSALLDPVPSDVEIEIDKRRAILRNGAIAVEVTVSKDEIEKRPSVALRFYNADTGDELLREAPSYFPRPPARKFKAVGGDHFKLELRFNANEGERFYGLGQHQHGLFDQKGAVIDQQQINTEVCIPFLYSNRGYGFLWNNPALGRVELGAAVTRWVAEATRQMDYWITAGATPAAVLAHYADATGHAPLLPEWAAGFWQCKLRYRTQDELLSIARGYKAARIAAGRHRHRLLPLDHAGRLAVRSRMLARPGGHDPRTGRDGRQGNGLHLAVGQPQ